MHLLCQSVRQSNSIISTSGASSLPICQTNEFDHLHLMHLLQQSVRSRNSIISTWYIFFAAPSDKKFNQLYQVHHLLHRLHQIKQFNHLRVVHLLHRPPEENLLVDADGVKYFPLERLWITTEI
jgi:hypothetical protein